MRKQSEADVGVVVGRFQTHVLTDGHIDLLNEVNARHSKMIVVLGRSPLLNTTRNPLDLSARRHMIREAYPDAEVAYVKDTPSDEVWSRDLDEIIADHISLSQSIMLYGSRDSFVNVYSGRFPTSDLEADVIASATELRRSISKQTLSTPEGRAGAIYAALNRFPTVYATVDVAIWNEDHTRLLMARKPKENLYRFVGGFADPRSPSFEADARREVAEETGLEISNPKYIGSTLVDDWRYRAEVDKIKTLLFEATRLFGGQPKANDDIAEVRWFDWANLREDMLVPTHHPLLAMLAKHEENS